MYGTPNSSKYAATHANTNKSTILTNLETWYNNNLKTYESVIDWLAKEIRNIGI